MEYKTYSLKPFDSNMAQRGNLCVATTYGYTGSTVNTDTAAFKGSYICTTINPQEFTVVIGGAALSTAVLTNLTADAIYNKIQTNIDGRIKAWLNATTIVSDGEEGWKLNVPNNI